MYIPAHFAPDEALVDELLRNHGAADLVTVTSQGLVATMLPFVCVPAAGAHGALHGHVARNNDQWKLRATGESLAIVRGPGRVHLARLVRVQGGARPGGADLELRDRALYGRLVVHDDPVWTEDLVRRLTAKHEAYRDHPWSVDDAPRAFIEGQLRAIVGVGAGDHPDRGEGQAQPEPVSRRTSRA